MNNRILPIYCYNNPILNTVCEDVDIELLREYVTTSEEEYFEKYKYDNYKNTNKIHYAKDVIEFINNMRTTLLSNSHAVALSANQLGKTYNICMIRLGGEAHTFINPKIISVSDEKEIIKEGCLSFPTLKINIERPIDVVIQFYDNNFLPDEFDSSKIEDTWSTKDDENNGKLQRLINKRMSRILQHELDHLKGKLFISYLSEEELNNISQELNRIKKGYIRTKYTTIN